MRELLNFVFWLFFFKGPIVLFMKCCYRSFVLQGPIAAFNKCHYRSFFLQGFIVAFVKHYYRTFNFLFGVGLQQRFTNATVGPCKTKGLQWHLLNVTIGPLFIYLFFLRLDYSSILQMHIYIYICQVLKTQELMYLEL